MISPASPDTVPHESPVGSQILVRYGTVPQVARYTVDSDLHRNIDRGAAVVIRTERGQELGVVLEFVPAAFSDGHETVGNIERLATGDDLTLQHQRQQESTASFDDWHQRIEDWKLEVELMDVERTLEDGKSILYVLNDRGAETTRLALLAAAAGLGIVTVQSISAEGIVDENDKGGGCGSGCGCGH